MEESGTVELFHLLIDYCTVLQAPEPLPDPRQTVQIRYDDHTDTCLLACYQTRLDCMRWMKNLIIAWLPGCLDGCWLVIAPYVGGESELT